MYCFVTAALHAGMLQQPYALFETISPPFRRGADKGSIMSGLYDAHLAYQASLIQSSHFARTEGYGSPMYVQPACLCQPVATTPSLEILQPRKSDFSCWLRRIPCIIIIDIVIYMHLRGTLIRLSPLDSTEIDMTESPTPFQRRWKQSLEWMLRRAA